MAGLSKGEHLASFPIEDVTCAKCGFGGCLLYPAQDQKSGAAAEFCPTIACPNCSTPEIEDFLRFASEQQGFRLKPTTVFGCPPVGPLAQFQEIVDQADAWILEALEGAWHATADGSNCTGEFGYTENGETAYFEGGPKPSYALAMLFDFEHFMRTGGESALPWQAGPATESGGFEVTV